MKEEATTHWEIASIATEGYIAGIKINIESHKVKFEGEIQIIGCITTPKQKKSADLDLPQQIAGGLHIYLAHLKNTQLQAVRIMNSKKCKLIPLLA